MSTDQDPQFVAVQNIYQENKPEEWQRYRNKAIAMAQASGLRGVTAEEVTNTVGRSSIPQNLPGAVFGSLRSTKVLTVVSREKSRHSEAKGRWVCRFALTSLVSQSQ